MNQDYPGASSIGAQAEDQTIIFHRAPVKVPTDLSEWIAPPVLAGWVLEIVHENNPAAWDLRGVSPDLGPENMPVIVLFAYCTGRFISEDVINACLSDPWLRDFSQGKRPFENELEQFRHRNRSLLEKLLFQLLVHAAQDRFLIPQALSQGFQQTLKDDVVGRLMAAHQVDVGFAEAED